jgi:N-acetylneuraminic acid mutarotase
MKATTTGRRLAECGALIALVPCMVAAVWLPDMAAAQERSWQPVAPMPCERFEHGVAQLADTLYVFGGYAPGVKSSKQVHAFDLAGNRVEDAVWAFSAGKWTQFGKLPGPLIGPGARILGGRLVVAGGAPRGFNPQSRVWALKPSQ